MDKIASRKIFRGRGLYVPDSLEIQRNQSLEEITLGFPLVVKPASHGSSIGLSIVEDKKFLQKAIESAFDFDQWVLLESYIRGREFTVGILDEKALPVIEIRPKNEFFDFEAKYRTGMSEYIVPADIEGRQAAKIQQAGFTAHAALGCNGCSRVDIIVDEEQNPHVLEVNTIPGLTETSLLPKAARAAGIDFLQLCVKLIRLAYEKTENKVTL